MHLKLLELLNMDVMLGETEMFPVRYTFIRRSCKESFHAFSLDYFRRYIADKTGKLIQPIVQGNSSFSVMGQET